MAFITDTFTDTSGVNLQAHTGESGTWTADSGSTTAVITDANRVRPAASGTSGIYYHSVSAPGLDLSVAFDLRCVSLLGNAGILARYTPGATPTYYMGRYNAATTKWEIYKSIAGSLTLLASSSNDSLGVNTTSSASLDVTGTNPVVLTLKKAGSTVASYSDSAVDRITTGSNVGLRMSNASSSNSIGIHLDNFIATDLGASPTNTVAPVVTGTRLVGQTLSCSTGTWTGSPSSYAYVWKLDGTAITGPSETTSTYVIRPGDATHTITCAVTATNGSGTSSPVTSNGLVAVAELVAPDVQFYTSATGLGGAPGAQITDPASVFDSVTFAEAAAGDVEYRAVFLVNTHALRSLSSTVAWVATQTSSATTDIAIGIAVEGAGSSVAAIADEQTPPSGVTFSAPSNEGAGLSIGTLAPGQGRGVWLRRTINAGTAAVPADTCTLGWSGTPS